MDQDPILKNRRPKTLCSTILELQDDIVRLLQENKQLKIELHNERLRSEFLTEDLKNCFNQKDRLRDAYNDICRKYHTLISDHAELLTTGLSKRQIVMKKPKEKA